MKSSQRLGLILLAVLSFSACQKAESQNQNVTDKNVVRAGDPKVDRTIGDKDVQFRIMGGGALAGSNLAMPGDADAIKALKALSQAKGTSSYLLDESRLPTARTEDSLLLALPMGLIGQQNIFGGVVTKVSDSQSDTLGRLKLMDLTPVHVRSIINAPDSGRATVTFLGCVENCSEASEQMPIFSVPVVAVDTKQQQVIVDLAALGDEMNLIAMLDPTGGYTKLKPKSTKTVAFDYSDSTLIFDVENHMIPVDSKDDPAAPAPETVFTTRWYLKLASGFNPAYASRPAADGVGFFMTERSANPKVTRFSATEFGGEPIKYFVKHVPKEYQDAFAQSFEAWNTQFLNLLGRKLITYEFLAEDDARNDLLVPGDIRFNIVEWDLMNLAPYGGLGPSIANQFTGETMSANVLVQGPTIMKMYKDWFALQQKTAGLNAQGRDEEAEGLVRDFLKSMDDMQAKRSAVSYKITLGQRLVFRNVAETASLQDPLMQRNDFEGIPAGYTFETYMPGYFIDMLSHELGHNMGLRHNFRGNLGATSKTEVGKTTRSIMDYMGREFRQLDRISEYDTMAIAYGYTGKKPTHTDWYCTDEDVASADEPSNSAECSRDDATADPFSYFEGQLTKAIVKLTNAGRTAAPTWTVPDMVRELNIAVVGLFAYATTTDQNLGKLTNFSSSPDRPKDAVKIKEFTLARVAAQVCANFDSVIAEKIGDDAKKKVQDNVGALKASVKGIKDTFPLLKAETLGGCL